MMEAGRAQIPKTGQQILDLIHMIFKHIIQFKKEGEMM